MAQMNRPNGEFGPKLCLPFALFAIVFALLIGAPTDARSQEQILAIKTSDPGSTIRLLTAPHTGMEICNVVDATSIKFFKRADHGPHKYAKIEVLEGACAGTQGYVPWSSLEPEPKGF